jgi:hypothetical protein
VKIIQNDIRNSSFPLGLLNIKHFNSSSYADIEGMKPKEEGK